MRHPHPHPLPSREREWFYLVSIRVREAIYMILRPVYAVIEREVLKLFRQRSRLLSAMVIPMICVLLI